MRSILTFLAGAFLSGYPAQWYRIRTLQTDLAEVIRKTEPCFCFYLFFIFF